MTTVVDPRIGSELARYRIEALLGRGGMSVVYLATDAGLGRRVALKLLAPELALDANFRERFLRESRIAASIEHASVIPVYEAGEVDGLLFLAMRYVEGTDLRSLLAREGPLDPQQALDILAQAGEALDVAHARGLIHRDVKPGNILLAREASPEFPEHVYLADFGLTKDIASESQAGDAGQFMGTADYMAPEQIEGDEVDARTDVYSLGCVLFECLTGRPPFASGRALAVLWSHVNDDPPALSDLRRDLPPALDAVVERALAKSPADRYRSCRDLVADARAATAPARAARPSAPVPRQRARLFLGGLAVILAVAVATVAVVATRPQGEEGSAPTLAIRTGAVQRIDTRTNELAATISLGPGVRAIGAGEGAVFTLRSQEGTLLVERIDPETNRVESRGSVIGRPGGFMVGLDAVWVGHATGPRARLTELDPSSLAVSREIQMAFTGRATRVVELERLGEMGVDGSGAAIVGPLWAASPAGFSVYRIRPHGSVGRGLADAVWNGEGPPVGLAVDEGGVWVALAGSVQRLDPGSGAEEGVVEIPFSPSAIAAEDGAVWVANPVADRIVRIDSERLRATSEHRVGDEPSALAVGGGSVWVANYRGRSVTRIDTATGAVLATIDVGGRPRDLTLDAGGLWVAVEAPPAEAGQRAYGAAVTEITERMAHQGSMLLQPYFQALVDGGFERALAVDPTISLAQLASLWEDGVRDLERLRPPPRFATDQERTVEQLREMIASYRASAEAIEIGDVRALEVANNNFERALTALLNEPSAEFKPLNALVKPSG